MHTRVREGTGHHGKGPWSKLVGVITLDHVGARRRRSQSPGQAESQFPCASCAARSPLELSSVVSNRTSPAGYHNTSRLNETSTCVAAPADLPPAASSGPLSPA